MPLAPCGWYHSGDNGQLEYAQSINSFPQGWAIDLQNSTTTGVQARIVKQGQMMRGATLAVNRMQSEIFTFLNFYVFIR